MARGKGKKTPRKNKTSRGAQKEEEDSIPSSSGGSSLGPFAGITAVVIIIAFVFRHQQPIPSDTTTHPAVIENLTTGSETWIPFISTAPEEKVIAQPPERIKTGFRIASFHNVDESPAKKEDLIHYLRYDDGYAVCLKKADLEFDEFGVWELKQAKLKYLEYIANDAPHWIVESPRSREATCRILTLTHEDFDGMNDFLNVMKGGNKEEILNFTLERQNNASEYRTIVCLYRLMDLMVDQSRTPELQRIRSSWGFDGTQAKEAAEKESVRTIAHGWKAMQDNNSDFHYYINGPLSTWVRPTSRPGEKGTMPLGKKEKKASLVVRKNPCSVKDSMDLIV